MGKNEYIDNERVLYKMRGKSSLYGKEADCLVTENHVVIEGEEPTEKIPLSCIKHCRDATDYQSITFYPGSKELMSNIQLTFLNDQNQMHKLSLYFKGAGEQKLFRGAIYRQLVGKFIGETAEPPRKSPLGELFSRVKERWRDKSRDSMCTGLRSLGIDAQMAARGRIEEEIHGSLPTAGIIKSLGIIHISEGSIRWVNVCKRVIPGGQGSRPQVTYYTEYGIPDSRLGPEFPPVYIPATRKKTTLVWRGEDYGLGVISRLNSDHQLKSRNVTIDAIGNYGCWIISTFSKNACVVPLRQEWNYYEIIASHLMPGRVDKVSREDKRGAVDLPPLKFYMQGRDPKAVSFPGGRRGCVANGTIEQGTIRDGDEVQIETAEKGYLQTSPPEWAIKFSVH